MAIGVTSIPIGFKKGTAWTTLTDGTTTIRKVVRNNYLCIDITLTALGFTGTEGVDWENIISYAL